MFCEEYFYQRRRKGFENRNSYNKYILFEFELGFFVYKKLKIYIIVCGIECEHLFVRVDELSACRRKK